MTARMQAPPNGPPRPETPAEYASVEWMILHYVRIALPSTPSFLQRLARFLQSGGEMLF